MLKRPRYLGGFPVHARGKCNVAPSQSQPAARRASKARAHRKPSCRLIKGLTGFATFAVYPAHEATRCFAPSSVRDRGTQLGPGSRAYCSTAQARLVRPDDPSVFFRANPAVQRSKITRSRTRLANNATDDKTLGGPTARGQIDGDEPIETPCFTRISNKPANRNLFEVLRRRNLDEMVRQSRHRRKTWNGFD